MNKHRIPVSVILLLICSMASGAEWKNPDKPNTGGWQNPDHTQPVAPKPAVQPVERKSPPPAVSQVRLTGELSVETMWVCQMEQTYNDKGSDGAQDVKFFQPQLPPGYRMLGGYAQGNHHGASGCSLAVRPANEASMALLQQPVSWRQIWTDKNSGAQMDGSIWHGEAASADYICLGSIAKQGYSAPNLPDYACVHQCLVEEIPVGGFLWSDAGTGASQNVTIYNLHNSNGFYAAPSHNTPATLVDIRRNPACKF